MSLAGAFEPRSDKRRRASGYSASSLRIVSTVLERIAERYGLAVEAVRVSHTKEATAARREWLVVVQDSWALSAAETARVCGVDHTSVLLAQKRRAELRAA